MSGEQSATTRIIRATSNPYIPAVFLSVVGFVTLAIYTIDHWMDPFWTVVIGAFVIVPVALGVTVVLNPKLLRNWTDDDDLYRLTIIVFLIGGILPWLWSIPSVRATYLAQVGDGETYQLALNDANADVRQTACRQFVLNGGSIHRVKRALDDHPRVAQQCIGRISPESRGDRLATAMADHWHHDIIHGGESTAPMRCTKARVLPFMPVEDRRTATALLDCSLRAETSTVRHCCSKAAERSFGRKGALLREVSPARLQATDAVGLLVGATFGQKDVVAQLGSVVGDLGLEGRPARWFATKMLCDSVQDRRTTNRDRLFFEWLMGAHSACLSHSPASLEASPDRICEKLMAKMAPDRSPGEAVCEARREAREAESVARRETLGDDDGGADLARRIVAGSRIVGRQDGGGGGGSGGVERSRPGVGPTIQRLARSGGNTAGRSASDGSRRKCLTSAAIEQMKSKIGAMRRRINGSGGGSRRSGRSGGSRGARLARMKQMLLSGGDPATKDRRHQLLQCIEHGPDNCRMTALFDRPRCQSSTKNGKAPDDGADRRGGRRL